MEKTFWKEILILNETFFILTKSCMGEARHKRGRKHLLKTWQSPEQPTWIKNMNTNISLNVIHVSNAIRIELNLCYKGFPICSIHMSHYWTSRGSLRMQILNVSLVRAPDRTVNILIHHLNADMLKSQSLSTLRPIKEAQVTLRKNLSAIVFPIFVILIVLVTILAIVHNTYF